MMDEDDQRALREALEAALAAADKAGDTLVAAKLSDCLYFLSRSDARR